MYSLASFLSDCPWQPAFTAETDHGGAWPLSLHPVHPHRKQSFEGVPFHTPPSRTSMEQSLKAWRQRLSLSESETPPGTNLMILANKFQKAPCFNQSNPRKRPTHASHSSQPPTTTLPSPSFPSKGLGDFDGLHIGANTSVRFGAFSLVLVVP